MSTPAGIPVPVLTSTAARNWLTYRRSLTRAGGDVDALLVQSGLQCLHRLNLITSDAGLITVHGLVQRATCETLTDDQVADLTWAAADAILEAWPPVERDTTNSQRLRNNTAAVYHHGRDALLHPDPHPVLAHAHHSLGHAGNPAGAAAGFEQLLADQLRVLGPDHLNSLGSRGSLASWW